VRPTRPQKHLRRLCAPLESCAQCFMGARLHGPRHSFKQTLPKDGGIPVATSPEIYRFRDVARNPLGARNRHSEIDRISETGLRFVRSIGPMSATSECYLTHIVTNKSIPSIYTRLSSGDPQLKECPLPRMRHLK
jgi:hypothetical protein